MKRISEYNFWKENYASAEGVHLIRIKDKKIYWVAESVEFPDCGEENPEGLRILAVEKSPILLDLGFLIEFGKINPYEEEEYERTSLVHYYESKEEYENFRNISECMLNLATAKENHDEIDIFMISQEELMDFIDVLMDGDYIIVPEEVVA